LRRVILAALALAAFTLLVAPAAFAGEPQAAPHVLPNALAEKQNALRMTALKAQLAGKIPMGVKVAKVGELKGKGQYVQLQQTGHSNIFVLLAEFGTQTVPFWGGAPGPLHNEMQAPNRLFDNSTIWYDNPNGGYTPELYKNLYFSHAIGENSVANYYQAQSSGQFTFDGDVTNWVKVPFNEARYGTDDCNGDGTLDTTVCTTVWSLLRDAADQWVKDQLASGKSLDDIKAYLAQYDVEDRYDYDEDGNFKEPDHYIDHFDLLHAGADEAVGGGAEGTDAIWSHRWFAWQGSGCPSAGCEKGPAGNQIGGFEIGAKSGNHTGFWVGDYLMIPENSGVGVIAHETGHDYGLPDEYDRTNVGDSPSGFWTIMAAGSYGGDGTNGIGNKPVDFNAWDKWQLGWLDPLVVDPLNNGKSEIKLGPAESATKKPQAVFVTLPSITKAIKVGTPTSGAHAWYSGMGDDYKASLARSVAVPATGTTTLTFKTWYEAELDFDYGYVEASTDGGQTWDDLATYTGSSGRSDDDSFGSAANPLEPLWIDQSLDLTPYAGKTITLRFHYVGDPGVTGRGFEVDDIAIANGATTLFSDDAESSDNAGWTPYNFRKTTNGDDVRTFNRAYVVENRQYMGYDATGLKSPYSFGFNNDPQKFNKWVEHFPYQDGVLVSLWDESMPDNDLAAHPGLGQILPIDMGQTLVQRPATNGSAPGCHATTGTTPAAGRYQVYDATLSTEQVDPLTLHRCSLEYGLPAHAGVTTFDDRNDYTYGLTGLQLAVAGGVITPKEGIVVRLKGIDGKGFANISVDRAS
jgi:immune inhibitor A